MIEVRNSRDIAAPPELVWRITVDVEVWPGWTPTVTKAEALQSGRFDVGSRYRLTQPLQRPAVWRVVDMWPGRRFVWIREGNLMNLRAAHDILPAPDGSRSILSLTFGGPGSRMLAPILRPILRFALQTENRAFEATAIAMSRAATTPSDF